MYSKLLSFFKQILSYFKQSAVTNKDDNESHILPKVLTDSSLPDVTTMEQTMFMFQRIRTVFDFAPPIPLISEMRIINRGLLPTYRTASSEDKSAIAHEINSTIHKFSHILPELDFLLSKIENVPIQKVQAGETEIIKKEIISALERVSYDKNALGFDNNNYSLDKKNHYITFDNNNKNNNDNS